MGDIKDFLPQSGLYPPKKHDQALSPAAFAVPTLHTVKCNNSCLRVDILLISPFCMERRTSSRKQFYF